MYFRYHRISGTEKWVFDFDPSLMEILIVGYVVEIRKCLSENIFPFIVPSHSSSPTISDLYASGGIMSKRKLYHLKLSFLSYVQDAISNDNALSRAVENALLIMPRKVRKSKLTKTRKYADSNSFKFAINEKVLTTTFQNRPDLYPIYKDHLKIVLAEKLDPDAEVTIKLVEELSPFAKELKAASKKPKKSSKKSAFEASASFDVNLADVAPEGSSKVAAKPSSVDVDDDEDAPLSVEVEDTRVPAPAPGLLHLMAAADQAQGESEASASRKRAPSATFHPGEEFDYNLLLPQKLRKTFFLFTRSTTNRTKQATFLKVQVVIEEPSFQVQRLEVALPSTAEK